MIFHPATASPDSRSTASQIEFATGTAVAFTSQAQNTDHPFVKQNGGYVIVTARGLSPVWERFIFIKELMHIFDDPTEATDSGDAFENLLSEFTQQTNDRWSPQMESEIDCFWMAANVMCPGESRKTLMARFEADPSQLDLIAEEIGMPSHSVAHLFSPNFETAMDKLLTNRAP